MARNLGTCSLLIVSGWKDTSMFLTGFLVVTGFAMPIVFVHTKVIADKGTEAVILGMFGAALVYGSLIVYLRFFNKKEDDMF